MKSYSVTVDYQHKGIGYDRSGRCTIAAGSVRAAVNRALGLAKLSAVKGSWREAMGSRFFITVRVGGRVPNTTRGKKQDLTTENQSRTEGESNG